LPRQTLWLNNGAATLLQPMVRRTQVHGVQFRMPIAANPIVTQKMDKQIFALLDRKENLLSQAEHLTSVFRPATHSREPTTPPAIRAHKLMFGCSFGTSMQVPIVPHFAHGISEIRIPSPNIVTVAYRLFFRRRIVVIRNLRCQRVVLSFSKGTRAVPGK
jgi:hypothetical protein